MITPVTSGSDKRYRTRPRWLAVRGKFASTKARRSGLASTTYLTRQLGKDEKFRNKIRSPVPTPDLRQYNFIPVHIAKIEFRCVVKPHVDKLRRCFSRQRLRKRSSARLLNPNFKPGQLVTYREFDPTPHPDYARRQSAQISALAERRFLNQATA